MEDLKRLIAKKGISCDDLYLQSGQISLANLWIFTSDRSNAQRLSQNEFNVFKKAFEKDHIGQTLNSEELEIDC